jgi:hypothetical protein
VTDGISVFIRIGRDIKDCVYTVISSYFKLQKSALTRTQLSWLSDPRILASGTVEIKNVESIQLTMLCYGSLS